MHGRVSTLESRVTPSSGPSRVSVALTVLAVALSTSLTRAQAPAPPIGIRASDHPGDNGRHIDIVIDRSPDDVSNGDSSAVREYIISRSAEPLGLYAEIARVPATDAAPDKPLRYSVELKPDERGEPFWFRAKAVGDDDELSDFAQTFAPATATREPFDNARGWLAVLMIFLCGSIVMFIILARRGTKLYVRPIAGLEAVEEAVGRATEMGRSCLFVPGIQDMNEIQTIAGLSILSRVAQRVAEYDAAIEVPTARSLVMTSARETVEAAYYSAGRPDAYVADRISYITDEQFGYVAYVAGRMVREKPAACFYMGAFFAESLILAETGNAIGAIQVAGTAMPSQLPFFVAACDYTLIGEEFYAASAYLSGDPDQIGSLKGQDVGKLIVAALMLIGCGLFTLGGDGAFPGVQAAAEYLKDVVLIGS